MPSLALRRRLSRLEIPLLAIVLLLFYLVTDRKDLGYAVGVLAGMGVLALAFFRPRLGLLCVLGLLFTESTLNVLNQLADTAAESDLSGVPYLVQTVWFAWGVLVIYVVLLLSYLCRELLKGKPFEPLSPLEWALLLPLIMALFYLPISMLYERSLMYYSMDILPMCIYAGIVVLARVFSAEGGSGSARSVDSRETRYFFLDWFIILNIAILVPLWVYNAMFDPWRSGYVGIAAIRFGMGPYDFNFFLVPILGMVLIYDDGLSPIRRRFYRFAFFFSLIRVVASLFRGAMAGTLIAIVVATLLVDAGRRGRWVRSLIVFAICVAAIIAVLVATIPAARTTFNVALVRRIQLALSEGAGVGSLKFRHLETQDAFEDGLKRPILGYGPGVLITKHFDPKKFAMKDLYLHSGYLWFWYKMGILGLGVVVFFFVGIYGTCISLLRRTLHPPDRGWVIGTLAATIAMLPVIQTNNMLIRSQGAYALTLLLTGLCLIAARYRGVPRDQLPPSGRAVKE